MLTDSQISRLERQIKHIEESDKGIQDRAYAKDRKHYAKACAHLITGDNQKAATEMELCLSERECGLSTIFYILSNP